MSRIMSRNKKWDALSPFHPLMYSLCDLDELAEMYKHAEQIRIEVYNYTGGDEWVIEGYIEDLEQISDWLEQKNYGSLEYEIRDMKLRTDLMMKTWEGTLDIDKVNSKYRACLKAYYAKYQKDNKKGG